MSQTEQTIDTTAIADRMVALEEVDNGKWRVRLYGVRKQKRKGPRLYVVVYEGGKDTATAYAATLRELISSGISFELERGERARVEREVRKAS